MWPPPPTFKVKGDVPAASGGASINGIKVTLTAGGYNDTTAGAGAYSITGVPNGTYTYTATDTSVTTPNQWHTVTGTVTVNGADVTLNFTMQKNPSFTGTVYDSSTLAPISGATVQLTGTGGPFTATTNASGVYTVYVTSTATSYTATASMLNYANTTAS